jgi:uncharacterized protein YhaN
LKFEKIIIPAFGPFTDKSFIFNDTKASFHLISGPNEAGKSSLLRAITASLFGIPERTTDDFLHNKNKLQIGIELIRQDKSKLSFIRRKGRKNTFVYSGPH